MKIIDPLHQYELDNDGGVVSFIKRTNGELIHNGTTNEELLEVLLDRTKGLDAKFPCTENKEAIKHMAAALAWFNERTKARVSQGVETQDKVHVSLAVPFEEQSPKDPDVQYSERKLFYVGVGDLAPEAAAKLAADIAANPNAYGDLK